MEKALTLDDYLAIVQRRIYFLIIPFVIVLATSVAVINALPKLYRSTGTIAVHSQIPGQLLSSTRENTSARESIGIAIKQVMTSENLRKLIEKHDLYPNQRGRTAKLRENSAVELVTTERRFYPRRGEPRFVTFTVGFQHGDPEIAAEVANDLIGLLLDQNRKSRTTRASDTVDFLEREAGKLSKQMQIVEEELAAYKQAHSNALPEHAQMLMSMLERAENELKSLERDSRALEGEQRLMEMELATLGTMVTTESTTGRHASTMSPLQQLAVLKAQLVEKSAVYGAAHPDVRSLKRKILGMEREVQELSSAKPGQSSMASRDPARGRIESQIATAEKQLASLQKQKKKVVAKIERLEKQILETPQVERGLKDLSRDYENAQREYEKVRERLTQAQLAESLEVEGKAERFVLLEPPMVPRAPVRPKKGQLLAFGFLLAVGSGGGVAFIAELLDKSIRGPSMLTSILKQHPLAVIPYIRTASEQRDRRRRHLLVLLAAMLIMLAAIALTHFFLFPVDSLLDPILEMIGFQ